VTKVVPENRYCIPDDLSPAFLQIMVMYGLLHAIVLTLRMIQELLMAGHLVVISGPDQGKSFPIKDGQTLVLGRGQASDTQINDAHMSRVHCRVQADGRFLRVIDAQSTGGTFVREAKIQTADLESGHVFRVGGTEIQFQLDAAPDQPTLMSNPAGAVTERDSGKSIPLKELVGTTLSRYRLDSVIAEGTSSTVFKGVDLEKQRTVAIKVLKPDFANDEEQMERFVRAMKTMMPIRHPNIVRLYYAGKNGPLCWAAMEFIDGENLASVISRIGVRGMLDWKDVFRIAVHICRALEEAWQQKLIHRNVTPTNILRRHSDKVCLLADLTLAKALEGTLARQVTQPGQIVGDLAYLSPERTRDAAEIDHRSDLYSLGATLYALLTGKSPFESPSVITLVRNIREADPVDPRKFQLSINESFRDVVMHLLQKRPEDRYQTPDDLMRELERIAKYNQLKMD
jgi:pSer/pThr/pTyr-binding forkhead associated (FHA) protein